jgi:acyl-CoA thioesterase FadM
MKRLKVQEPDKYIFSTDLRIRISDLNYGNHLSNDAFLRFAHEARMQFFESIDYTELDIEGVGTIMADCEIQFLGQGYFGDEVRIDIGIADYSRAAFNLVYRFTNLSDSKTMALIRTSILGFDYKNNKVVAFPEQVWDKMGLPIPQ